MVFFHLYMRLDIAACGFLEPDWDETTRGNDPGFGRVDVRGYNMVPSKSPDEPWDAVEEDVGSHAGYDTVSDANNTLSNDSMMNMGTHL